VSIWLTMIIVGLLTFGIRLSFIFLFGRRPIPARVRRGLEFVPPAVLSAIIFPELLMPGGTLDISLGNLRLLAGLVASLVAWRTRNVVVTIIAGVASLLIIQVLIG